MRHSYIKLTFDFLLFSYIFINPQQQPPSSFLSLCYFLEGLICLGGLGFVRPFSSVKGFGLGEELGFGLGLFFLLIELNLELHI